jgi:hypothetical protein
MTFTQLFSVLLKNLRYPTAKQSAGQIFCREKLCQGELSINKNL